MLELTCLKKMGITNAGAATPRKRRKYIYTGAARALAGVERVQDLDWSHVGKNETLP